MVDFTLSEEQINLREMAHDFAEKEIRAVAWDYDRDGTWPQAIIDKEWEVGLMNNQVRAEYGGAGASSLEGCLIAEELAWGSAGIATTLEANGLASAPLQLGGSEKLKKEYLGRLTEAPLPASFCLTEPGAGSDVSGMRTYTVYAKTDKDAGHRGISCFIVPRDAGVVVDKHEDKMGLRASSTAAITFEECEIPADHLLGEENHGFRLAMMTLDRSASASRRWRPASPAPRWSSAIDYSKERIQFGVPVAMHKAIQFMIADMATGVEATRLLTWKSAVLLDQGKRNTLASPAKRFAADTAMKAATDTVQVYGGYGFIKEYPVEKRMRNAKIMQLYEGTSQIQRLVIARETLLPRRIEQPAAAREACL
jgi:acyl-CoA dehydrogenase